MNTTYINHLPIATSSLRELQWSVDHWQQMYAEAGEQKEKAWNMYQDAIDQELPRATIDDLYATAQLFDDITRDTWREYQEAKKQLLDLLS